MKLGIITPTRNRFYTLSLLHKYISRQTRKPDLWIIATDGEIPELPPGPVVTIFTHSKYSGVPVKSFTGNLIRAINVAEEKGMDAVLIMEDDDWYAPEYVERMEKMFATADVIGNKPTKSINVKSGVAKEVQHSFPILAQLGFLRSKNDVFRTAVEKCLQKNISGVDKMFDTLCKAEGTNYEILQSPQIYFGMKGIYDIGNRQSQGITKQHRQHRKHLKGHLTRLQLLLNRSKRNCHEQSVYQRICDSIGREDAAAYRSIIAGAKQTEWKCV